MDKVVRKMAVGFAVVVLFAMAITGQVCHRPVMTCCTRAISGAIVTYVIVSFAMRAIFAIFIHAIAKDQMDE